MTDFYLKFADKTQADSVLYTNTPVLAVVDTEGNVITPAGEDIVTPKFANIDVIGTIYRPTGEVETVDGMEVPVMAALDGYHVNIRAVDGEDTSALTSFAVVPSVPQRIWG
jgi:hypothetical protein